MARAAVTLAAVILSDISFDHAGLQIIAAH